MDSIVKSLSEIGSVPLAIQITTLFVSFYWFKKSFQTYNGWIEKEIDKLWNEVTKIKEESSDTRDQVIEMANDIKWIRENLTKKIK